MTYLIDKESAGRRLLYLRLCKTDALVEKYRAALFCPHCKGTGEANYLTPDNVFIGVRPCPTCGPIRKELKEGE